MRLPTYKELRRFVEVEGWEDKDEKSKKKKGDHHRYTYTTPMGERLFTRISHGRGQIQDPELFAQILKDQLCIDKNQFWKAVDKGIKPTRASLTHNELANAIDAKLARNLINKVGMKPEQLIGIDQQRAVKIWQEWLTTTVPSVGVEPTLGGF